MSQGDVSVRVLGLTLQQANGQAKKAKAESKPPRANTAIYVTSLPLDVEFDEVVQVFKKFGMLAENYETNMPRIKLYKNDDGEFKGDALVVYNRPESVRMAIDLLDETDFRPGQKLATGPMRITEADSSYKVQKEQPLATEDAKKKGTNANKDRQKIIKKNEEMKRWATPYDASHHSSMNTPANAPFTGVSRTGAAMTTTLRLCHKPRAAGTRSSF